MSSRFFATEPLPLGLAVGCMMVAVPAAVVPIPLALGVIGILIIGLPPTNAVPVIMAALIAFAVAHGLIMAGGGKKKAGGSDSKIVSASSKR